MHAYIHSFIQSTIFTLSLFHKNEPSITTAIHHNLQSSIHQSSTMHCTDHSVGQSYMHAWCCHDSHTMERNCMRIPLANHHLTEIHTYTHTCIEMTTSSHPLNVLMSIFGGGGGGDIDHRVGTAATMMLGVDSWMIDLKAMMVMRICVMRGRRMTYILHMYTQRQRTTGPKQEKYVRSRPIADHRNQSQ